MVRSFLILFLSAAFVAKPSSESGSLDPAFEKIPFDQWLAETDRGRFHWTPRVSRAELSFHQRLVAPVEIKLDGRDLDAGRTRGTGKLVFLVQVTDSDGTRYQTHHAIELSKLDENIKAANLEYSQRAFFLPGDYRLAVAILDTVTGDHSTRQTKFRIAPPPHDLLPGAWRDLPPVEFLGDEQPPDGRYLPDVRSRLQWAASVHSSARINIILNIALSLAVPQSRHNQSSGPSSDLAALLPTLKAISQPGSSSLSEHIELLDLARRRAVFDQNGNTHDLDWPKLKASLGEASTASIDVHSLAERHHDAQFFVSEVRRLLRASTEPCVLVVLTSPVAFESGEDLEPISLEALPACRVVYIRYRAQPVIRTPEPQIGGRGRGSRWGGQGPLGRARDRRSPQPEHHRSVRGYTQAAQPQGIRCRDARTDGKSYRRNRKGRALTGVSCSYTRDRGFSHRGQRGRPASRGCGAILQLVCTGRRVQFLRLLAGQSPITAEHTCLLLD